VTIKDYKNGLVHAINGGPYRYAGNLMYYFLCGGDCLTTDRLQPPYEAPTCFRCIMLVPHVPS
jgi:hypothetical protein